MIIEAREDTITLRGAVKTDIWPAIQAAAALLLENHPTGIIIDCSAITQFTRKGAQTFADASRYIHAHNARILLTGLSPELIEITRSVPEVRSQLPIAATVEEARASLRLEELEPKRGKARMAAVVPMLGNWRRAVDHASRLALGENCEIHLVDLIKMPRTLALDTPLPERETQGQSRLGEAKRIAQKLGLKCFSHVERVRSDAGGLADFVRQLSADFAVVSLNGGDTSDSHIAESEALSLLESAEFEILLLKSAAGGEVEATEKSAVVPAIGAWEEALRRACKLVAEDAAITVVYIISIPRAEPIDAPKPDEEVAASDCGKEALRIGKKYGVKVTATSIRVRDPILGFVKTLSSMRCGLVVVGVMGETDPGYPVAHATATVLLRESPCETVFLRVRERL